MNAMNILIISVLVSLMACTTPQDNKKEIIEAPVFDTVECSNLYLFEGTYYDMDKNERLVTTVLPDNHFKKCSKFAHRFTTAISDTVMVNGRKFFVDRNRDEGIYNLKIYENNKYIKTIHLPVEDPLPEVQEYTIYLLSYKNDVIMFMEDFYSTHYVICKYNSEGEELFKDSIEHTYITHPEPNTNHYHRYLHISDIIASQMIFTSHMAFADTFKTIVLDMNTFEINEFNKMSNGIILDENEEDLVGFVTEEDGHFTIQMLDGKEYEFEIQYGDGACEFILKGNLLYIANYHPISTGSSLRCFDLNTGEMKWIADVKQVNACHSKYYNHVYLSMYKDKIIMEGIEAYGNYLQIFDAQTGERLAVWGSFFELEEIKE